MGSYGVTTFDKTGVWVKTTMMLRQKTFECFVVWWGYTGGAQGGLILSVIRLPRLGCWETRVRSCPVSINLSVLQIFGRARPMVELVAQCFSVLWPRSIKQLKLGSLEMFVFKPPIIFCWNTPVSNLILFFYSCLKLQFILDLITTDFQNQL